MTKFILLAALATPLAANACPDLAGTYRCGVLQNSILTIADQEDAYTFNINHFYTSNPGSAQNATYYVSKIGEPTLTREGINETELLATSTCTDNELELQATVTNELGNVQLTKSIQKDSDGNLIKSTRLTLANGATQEGPTETCLRSN